MGELPAKFRHGTDGLTRFPPNVHQLSVTHEGPKTWLTARHNDVVLKFPLDKEDCRHLAALLAGYGSSADDIVSAAKTFAAFATDTALRTTPEDLTSKEHAQVASSEAEEKTAPASRTLEDLSKEYLRQGAIGGEFRRLLAFAHAQGLLAAALRDAGLADLYPASHGYQPSLGRSQDRANR